MLPRHDFSLSADHQAAIVSTIMSITSDAGRLSLFNLQLTLTTDVSTEAISTNGRNYRDRIMTA